MSLAKFTLVQESAANPLREPFKELLNTISAADAEASPSIRQQGISEAEVLNTRYKSRPFSVDSLAPTPSPVLSSSADLPFSPSIRCLIIVMAVVTVVVDVVEVLTSNA